MGEIDQLEDWQTNMIPWLAAMDGGTVDKLETWQRAMVPFLAGLDQPPAPTGVLPAERLGGHWIPASNRASDHAYFKALRPGVLKVVTLDPNRIKEAMGYLDPSPYSVLVVRDHPLSEQKSDAVADPIGTGKRHAREWRDKFAPGGRLAGIDTKRIVVCGINEPFVQNAQQAGGVAAYTKALLEDLKTYGLRGLALNLSVGWPRNADTATVKNTKPIWDEFLGLEGVILSGNHILGLHEYWRNDPDESWHEAPNGEKWGWNAHRHWACPLAVPIIIGECGLTKEVAGSPVPGQSIGWIGNVSAPQYAEQLWRYADKCHPNVLGVMPFTTDMASADWAMDDTAGAHADILARKHNYAWPAVWPVAKPVVVPPVEPPEDEVKTIILPAFAGKITGFYGQDYGYPHEGQDVSMVSGTPLYAAYDGVIAWSDYEPETYGNYVRLFAPALKANFFYGHLQERKVQTGNSVKQGQLIGYSGNTGNSSGAHLHLEIRQTDANGAYIVHKPGQPLYRQNGRVDPLGWLAGWISMGGLVEYR